MDKKLSIVDVRNSLSVAENVIPWTSAFSVMLHTMLNVLNSGSSF